VDISAWDEIHLLRSQVTVLICMQHACISATEDNVDITKEINVLNVIQLTAILKIQRTSNTLKVRIFLFQAISTFPNLVFL